MAWLIYAVLRLPAPAAVAAGVEGAAVSLVAEGRLCAAVSQHTRLPPPATPAALAFGAVVDALFRHRDLLPMRFGTAVGDVCDLHAWLALEQDSYGALLQRIAGCVEMGVRSRCTGAAVEQGLAPDAGPGHAYLAARARRDAATGRCGGETSRQAARFAAALAGTYRDWRLDGAEDDYLCMSFLVPRQALEDFLYRCRRVARQDEAPPYVTGPWPPYSFAGPTTQTQPAPPSPSAPRARP